MAKAGPGSDQPREQRVGGEARVTAGAEQRRPGRPWLRPSSRAATLTPQPRCWRSSRLTPMPSPRARAAIRARWADDPAPPSRTAARVDHLRSPGRGEWPEIWAIGGRRRHRRGAGIPIEQGCQTTLVVGERLVIGGPLGHPPLERGELGGCAHPPGELRRRQRRGPHQPFGSGVPAVQIIGRGDLRARRLERQGHDERAGLPAAGGGIEPVLF